MRYDGRDAAARMEAPPDLRDLDVKWEGSRLLSEAAFFRIVFISFVLMIFVFK